MARVLDYDVCNQEAAGSSPASVTFFDCDYYRVSRFGLGSS